MIHAAGYVFHQKATFDEQIRRVSKSSKSYWYCIFFFIGIALHHLSDAEDLGSGIAFVAFGAFCLNQYIIGQLGLRRDQSQERLYALAVTWGGAVDYWSFWQIPKSVNESGIDDKDDAFCEWWGTQRKKILERVCEYENRSDLVKLKKFFNSEGLAET